MEMNKSKMIMIETRASEIEFLIKENRFSNENASTGAVLKEINIPTDSSLSDGDRCKVKNIQPQKVNITFDSVSKEEVLDYIRYRLAFNSSVNISFKEMSGETISKEHYRFDMSGYETDMGFVVQHNQMVLNKFAHLGIYDYTYFLCLDFYKGGGTLYMKYWNTDIDSGGIKVDLWGLSTVEIIYKIFELTVFTNRPTRRRV